MTILAIDPGPTRSAYVIYDGGAITHARIVSDSEMLALCRHAAVVAIETMEPWGGFSGPPALETMQWVGRFREAVEGRGGRAVLIKRSTVLAALGIGRLPKSQTQAAVRACLLDRFPGPLTPSGRPAKGHPLRGVTGDMWSALALAIAYVEEGQETVR